MTIIADEYVSKEFGTGMVKVTPAHDPNDYLMGKRHNLQEINILHPDGRINENGGPYNGLDRYEARKKIVKDLEALGALEKIEDYTHSVGHCYRCHTAIEPYVSEQWFVRMKELAAPAILAVEQGKTRFVPKMWENTYYHWMRNVRDWCISRQLWWGHRIPAWTCDSCGHIEVSADHAPERCSSCGHLTLTRDPDVLDTWFSSALWPFSTLGWPEETKDLEVYYPTSVLVTAHEILFFWVARMIMMGLKFRGEVPFHDVYIHAMVFDEKTKKKMSKSLGNVIDPLEMIEKYGADALRMTLCAYAIKGKNLYMSEERFVGYRNFMNKVWNAARFVLSGTEDLTAEQIARGIDEQALSLEDRWILSVFARTIRDADAALDDYSFDQLTSILYHFVWHQYCDWYLEFSKPRLSGKEDPRVRTNTQLLLIYILEGILRLLHPVIPFTTEEIWQKIRERYSPENFPKGMEPNKESRIFFEALSKPSIMIAPWKQAVGEEYINEGVERTQDLIRDTIYTIRNIRGEMNIPPGTATDVYISGGESGTLQILKDNQKQLATLLNTKILVLGGALPAGEFSSTGVVQDCVISVTLPEEMREEEMRRLEKELEKTEKDLSALEKKMANENFITRAPGDIVENARRKMEQLRHEKDRMTEQLRRLQAK
jgi:valyl-tRNA synthetase